MSSKSQPSFLRKHLGIEKDQFFKWLISHQNILSFVCVDSFDEISVYTLTSKTLNRKREEKLWIYVFFLRTYQD